MKKTKTKISLNRNDLLSQPVEKTCFCVVDVETTGLSARYNNIIEIGLVKISNLKITDRFHTLINPGREIPYYITQFTGISNDDVYQAPFFDQVSDQIENFISDSILAGHNLSFDDSFLKREFIYAGKEELHNHRLCTLKLSRRLFPELRSKSLGAVAHHLKIHNDNAHRALSDAEVTAKLLIKIIKKVKKSEGIKTVGELLQFQKIHAPKKSPFKIKKSLANDLAVIPEAPGIYYFLNSKNEFIYIGKAKSLRERVRSYFLPTAPSKAKKIVKQAARLKVEITNSELTALLLEAELIKILNPKHNFQLKRYGDKYFIRVSVQHKAPDLQICNYFDFDGNDYFGLFISRKKAQAVYDMIQRTFALRECTDAEFGKGKACFLSDIGRCTAPCVNNNEKLYNEELQRVYEFLYGKNHFALSRLLNKMKFYSDRTEYEKAAELKNLIDLLLAQTHKSSLLSEPVNKANVLFTVNEKYGTDFLLMIEGKIYIKSYGISKENNFDEALDDYFGKTINVNLYPGNEDLEKMKITLNWIIKNRNKVGIYYLKNYQDKEHLFRDISFRMPVKNYDETVFDIKKLIEQYEVTS